MEMTILTLHFSIVFHMKM